jgi:hypothetical protein
MIARSTLYLSLVSICSAVFGAAQPILVDETTTEFQTLADVNGDGTLDIVVVDKAGGQVRIAQSDVNGSISWRSSALDSGLRDVTGFCTGYCFTPGREALALASSLDNRIQLIDTPSEATLIEPQALIHSKLGPSLITALQVPGGPVADYTPDFDDLIYHAIYHDPSNDNSVQGFRNRDGSLPMEEFAIAEASTPGVASHPEAVTLQAGMAPAYAVLRSESGVNLLELYNVEPDPIKLIGQLPDLPYGCDFVAADFDNDGEAEFLIWSPGSSELYETEWNGGLTGLSSFTYPDDAPIEALRVVYSTGQPQLIVIHSYGSHADRVSYAGAGNLSIEERFTPKSGQPFSGALSSDEVLHLLTGYTGSNDYESHRFDSATNSHNLEASGSLPSLQSQEAGSSVLIFDDNPLTRPEAKLMSRLSVGAWTSAFALGGGIATVDHEAFIDSESGLGNLQTATINHPPAGSSDGLTRQVFDDLSMRFDAAPVGEVVAQLSLLTPSGDYTVALRPELSLNGSGTIWYRENDSSWSKYQPDNPPVIISDSTFYAFAVDSSGRFSNIVRAEYTFWENPGEQDSNGDGVPDFVAQQHGLDPLNDSWDSDADGFSDLHEILAGTNPNDGGDTPARADVDYALPNQFDLSVTPAIPNPSAPGSVYYTLASSPNQTQVQAHMPSGVLLDRAATENLSQPQPTALLSGLQSEHRDLFLIVSTELNFDVDDGAGTAAAYGRQLAGIFPSPELDYTPFTFDAFGAAGGVEDLAAEASAWQVAALAHYTGLAHPAYSFAPLDHTDSLQLLLVETFLGSALNERGLIDRSNLSLTPFRASEAPLRLDQDDNGDGERDRAVDHASLLSLQREPTDAGSSYRLHSVIELIDAAIDSPATAEQSALVELARLLYTLHALDATPGSLRQPFDALRHFLRTGNLNGTGFDQSAFAADLSSSLLTDAATGVTQILDLPEARSATTVYVYHEQHSISSIDYSMSWSAVNFSDNFDPHAPDYTGDSWSLVDENGEAFQMGRAFPLTSGSVIAVRGYELPTAMYSNRILEVIGQPELIYLSHQSTIDGDGDLIPDALEALAPNLSFDALGDSDGDGYSDLQEMLHGSDPHLAGSYPMDSGSPAPIDALQPPTLAISADGGYGLIEFDYPASYADHIAFDLYQSSDLQTFTHTWTSAEYQGDGSYQLSIRLSDDKTFYRLRMRLKWAVQSSL